MPRIGTVYAIILASHMGYTMSSKAYKDCAILARFIAIYCQAHHENRTLVAPAVCNMDLSGLPALELCPDCTKLLLHALVKRSHCPMDPKPACKNCPSHCYAPIYRQKIQEVMRFSGRRLVLTGRVDYLWHLLF